MTDAMRWPWFAVAVAAAVVSVFMDMGTEIDPILSANTAWGFGWVGGVAVGWIVHGVVRVMHPDRN